MCIKHSRASNRGNCICLRLRQSNTIIRCMWLSLPTYHFIIIKCVCLCRNRRIPLNIEHIVMDWSDCWTIFSEYYFEQFIFGPTLKVVILKNHWENNLVPMNWQSIFEANSKKGCAFSVAKRAVLVFCQVPNKNSNDSYLNSIQSK